MQPAETAGTQQCGDQGEQQRVGKATVSELCGVGDAHAERDHVEIGKNRGDCAAGKQPGRNDPAAKRSTDRERYDWMGEDCGHGELRRDLSRRTCRQRDEFRGAWGRKASTIANGASSGRTPETPVTNSLLHDLMPAGRPAAKANMDRCSSDARPSRDKTCRSRKEPSATAASCRSAAASDSATR